ncbi:response regulator [Cohnella sp. GbtcB17]|uniref:response regulator n=1 Tax=Cohnella sp. GbtcB17 TaxID=2824762 RepID=UPI001C30855B|nr:response regulator [Cohnella sp. GbtcB17]
MNITKKIWGLGLAFLLLLGGLTAIASVYTHGQMLALSIALGALGLSAGAYLIATVHRSIFTGMRRISRIVDDMAAGRTDVSAHDDSADGEFGELARRFRELAVSLHHKTEQERQLREDAENEIWVNANVSEMAILLQGSVQVQEASRIFMSKLAGALGASCGALYVKRGEALHFAAGYAYDDARQERKPIPLGVGLVGQAALDKKPVVMRDLPADYIKISSGLGETPPSYLTLVPILYENETVGIVELASLHAFSPRERQLIDRVSANMGILFNTLADIARIDELLRHTQKQKEELEAQTEELQSQTEELAAQTEELRTQTEELDAQARQIGEANETLRTEVLLTARQKEEIAAQAESLARQKEEIAQQADSLADQAEELRVQADELRVSNEQLKTEMALTARQKDEIQQQAEEIFMAAQYKSEFLANVSLELRTPLNSLLILSQILAENRTGNLQPKQLEYVHTIFSAGRDLLRLIDEILDLAKLEAGKMTAVFETVQVQDVVDHAYRTFDQVARGKGVELRIRLDPRLPASLRTDGHRLQQILANLLSNAFKFTDKGEVSLTVRRSDSHPDGIFFEVKDTGIGIPKEKLDGIFEAFQQADGTTSRKYGGTGLGLSICRQLASLLGGRIEVSSEPGKGSIFTLLLSETAETDNSVREQEQPFGLAAPKAPSVQAAPAGSSPEADSAPAKESTREPTPSMPSPKADSGAYKAPPRPGADFAEFYESFVPDISISNPKLLQQAVMDDDRSDLQPGDTTLLIIEEEESFAAILLELARKRGFKAIVSLQGDQGLALAHAYKPDAIVVDADLPVLNGWAIISRLKSRPELRHIPVHIVSTADDSKQGLSMGALDFWKKPTDRSELEAAFLRIESYIRRPVKNLLIVEDNDALRASLVAFIAHPDVSVTAAASGKEALDQLNAQHFDCMVLDLGLADISGFELLEQVKTNRKLQTLPVIIYTGRDLSKEEEERLRHYAESIVLKNVQSMERLYDETALYLHRRHADLPPDKQLLIEKLHNPEAAFEGKQILLVDDDMRNIYALSSVLEGYNMEISFAQNGKEALQHLSVHPGVDLVFMDIMMPEMDGYETMRRIRQMPQYENLVIIALTARAMEGDRVKCLRAGASDYIAKPINTTQLVTLLKAWLIK